MDDLCKWVIETYNLKTKNLNGVRQKIKKNNIYSIQCIPQFYYTCETYTREISHSCIITSKNNKEPNISFGLYWELLEKGQRDKIEFILEKD